MNIISSPPSITWPSITRARLAFRSTGRLLLPALHVLCTHAYRVHTCGRSLTLVLYGVLAFLTFILLQSSIPYHRRDNLCAITLKSIASSDSIFFFRSLAWFNAFCVALPLPRSAESS